MLATIQSRTFCPSHLLSKNIRIRVYKTIILIVVLYMCESWSLTLREEHGLSVFVNRVLRRIFRPKRDEVMGVWRKVRNEELRNLYSLLSTLRMNMSRRVQLAMHVAQMGVKQNAHRILVENQKERDH
jgi:hypothetical protein